MNKIKLPDVTLVTATDLNLEAHAKVMAHCQKEIEFGDSLFLSCYEVKEDSFRWESIPLMGSSLNYSIFIMKELYKHILTPYILNVQADGYILHPNLWTDEFLNFDFIGSPCGWGHIRLSNGETVGPMAGCNGGFTLRSTALMEEVSKLEAGGPEDVYICIKHREHLVKKGFRFANPAQAARFAKHYDPNDPPFGFHGTDKYHAIPRHLMAY